MTALADPTAWFDRRGDLMYRYAIVRVRPYIEVTRVRHEASEG